MRKSATSPTVTNHFSPLSRKPSPSGSATVSISDGSEPAFSSVTAKQSRRSPRIAGIRKRSRWPAVQWRSALAGRHTASHSALVSWPSALLDDHLVKHREPLTAPLRGHVDRVEAMLEGQAPDLGQGLVGQAAAGLARLLERDDGGGQALGALAQLVLLGGVGEVHWRLLGG